MIDSPFIAHIAELPAYSIPLLFLATLFIGEAAIFAAAFLSAHGVWSPFTVFAISLLSSTVSDAAWFYAGSHASRLVERYKRPADASRRLFEWIERIVGHHPLPLLIAVKFIYGIRIISIVYLALKKIPFLTFFWCTSVGSIIWLAVIITLGHLAGAGLLAIDPAHNPLGYAALGGALIVICVRLSLTWFARAMAGREKDMGK